LILVIAIEHILLLLKIFIEQGIEDTPEEVVKGERDRKQILANFKKETTEHVDGTNALIPALGKWKSKLNNKAN